LGAGTSHPLAVKAAVLEEIIFPNGINQRNFFGFALFFPVNALVSAKMRGNCLHLLLLVVK
jgi:hypothetical protein